MRKIISKLHTILIILLSLALVACNTTKPSDIHKLDEKEVVSTSCLPLGSKDQLLSVEIQEIENCNIQVVSTFDVKMPLL